MLAITFPAFLRAALTNPSVLVTIILFFLIIVLVHHADKS